MSTDLHAALREAVVDSPYDETDLQRDLRGVIEAGSRRVHRRRVLGVATSAVALAAVVTSVLVTVDRSDRSGPEPGPARIVQLNLDQARTQKLEVLASTRTKFLPESDEGGYDRYEGVTPDGLVLTNRYIYPELRQELGLLNPETGRTDPLPAAPETVDSAVQLTADRLVVWAPDTPYDSGLLTFDRATRTWSGVVIRRPAGIEAHAPPQLELAPDGRLYLGASREGELGPMRWWSYAPDGGDPRPEPALTGAAVAWGSGVRATADTAGKVTLTSSSGTKTLSSRRPPGCAQPAADSDFADAPITLRLAGQRPVVTYLCGDRQRMETVVYDPDRGTAHAVPGAVVRAADPQHVLLVGQGEKGPTFVLDLATAELSRIGPSPFEGQVGLAGGLVLRNEAGPSESKDVYDVVWNVSRLRTP